MSQVATRVPLFTTWDDDDPFIVLTENLSVAGPNTWKHFGPVLISVISVLLRQEKRSDLGRLDLVSAGFWEGDYGWGVRVRRPFGARGRSSVRCAEP